MKNFAFTMAEILLSLTIIGVVAAITLPSLTGNINERTWNTQRKALYSRLSQAISLMPSLNGYGTYSGVNTDGTVSVTEDTAAETFITAGLSKVLKINNICDAEHLTDCGIPASYIDLKGGKVSWPLRLSSLNEDFVKATAGTLSGESYNYVNPQKDIDTKAAAFETQNGESIALYYNPQCQAYMEETTWYYAQTKMCANFVYDLNGTKGPNTVGKDIGFLTVFYATDPIIVSPAPLVQILSNNSNSYNAQGACKTQDSESRLPNIDELSAMFVNKYLLGYESGSIAHNGFWSSSILLNDKSRAWYQSFNSGVRTPYGRGSSFGILCIKR